MEIDFPVGPFAAAAVGGRTFVRPAWARSWRWKSSHKLTTANEAKRNCARATERREEAWSETASRWTRTGYEAMPSRASRQVTAKLLWSRLRWRKSGGCAGKDRVLTWGDLASWLKGRRGNTEREVSSGRSSCQYGAKGQRGRRRCPVILGNGLSQMFAIAKLAEPVPKVKPDALRQRETKAGGLQLSNFRRSAGTYSCTPTSTTPTARCGPACRVVWEGTVR